MLSNMKHTLDTSNLIIDPEYIKKNSDQESILPQLNSSPLPIPSPNPIYYPYSTKQKHKNFKIQPMKGKLILHFNFR